MKAIEVALFTRPCADTPLFLLSLVDTPSFVASRLSLPLTHQNTCTHDNNKKICIPKIN